MKLLVITQYFFPETFRINALCAELVRRGHEVTVLTGYPQYPYGKIYDGYGFSVPYENEWMGVRIERVKVLPRGKTPFGLLLNFCSIAIEGSKWVRHCTETFDAVFVYGLSPVTVGLPAVAYKKRFGTPIYYNLLDLWPDSAEIVLGIRCRPVISVLNRIVRRIYAASDRILCSSESVVQTLTARGVPAEKTVFWPQFCTEPQTDTMTRPACYSPAHFNIVFTGNLGEAQGLDLLIDTAIKCRDSRVRWFLVGDGRAGDRLKKRVADNGLETVVSFIGRVTEAEANRYTYFADCAYLSFQKNEFFEKVLPAKLTSYLACGIPILAAAGGESARVIDEARCGFVCEQDAERLAALISEELLPSTELDDMRIRAKQYYEAHFTKARLVDDLEALMACGTDS